VTDKKQKNSYHFIFQMVSYYTEKLALVIGFRERAACRSSLAATLGVAIGHAYVKAFSKTGKKMDYRAPAKVLAPTIKRVVA